MNQPKQIQLLLRLVLESTQTLDEATQALHQKLLSLSPMISAVAFSGACGAVFQWIYPPSYLKFRLHLHPSFRVSFHPMTRHKVGIEIMCDIIRQHSLDDQQF